MHEVIDCVPASQGGCNATSPAVHPVNLKFEVSNFKFEICDFPVARTAFGASKTLKGHIWISGQRAVIRTKSW
jgi:hypothetical protein